MSNLTRKGPLWSATDLRQLGFSLVAIAEEDGITDAIELLDHAFDETTMTLDERNQIAELIRKTKGKPNATP